MKKAILVSVFCLLAITNGFSQTKQESIKELFHLMKSDSLMDKTFTSIIPGMLTQMQGESKDSVSTAHFKDRMNSVMSSTKEICKRLLNEDMVTIYEKYFNQKEINDFIGFYKTPAGQKLVNVTPDIQKEIMTVMMQKYMPEIQKSMKASIEEHKNSQKK